MTPGYSGVQIVGHSHKLVRSKVTLMYNRGPKQSEKGKYNIQLVEERERKAKYQQFTIEI